LAAGVKGSGGLSGTDLPVLISVGLILLAGVLFGVTVARTLVGARKKPATRPSGIS